jgi:uncharacterized protein YdaU (DUF1376 family)/ribosomal protein S27AE
MKTTFYFSHDYHARSDEKIVRMLSVKGSTAYGIYWMLVEMLFEHGGEITRDYDLLSYELRSEKDIIRAVCEDFELFYTNIEGKLRSFSVDRRINERLDRSQKALQSASRRWGNANASKNDANAMRTHNEADTNASKNDAIKERKGKERKEKEINNLLSDKSDGFVSFWQAYPRKVGRAAALKSWKKGTPPLDKCLLTLSWQCKSEQWTKEGGQYIPLPATWLNQARWQDIPDTHKLVVCPDCGHEGILPKTHSGKLACSKCAAKEAANV